MSRDILLERYWLGKLKDAPDRVSLCAPGRAGTKGPSRDEVEVTVPENVLSGISKITKGAGGRYCYMLAAMGLLLNRYSGEEDLLIALPEIMQEKHYDPHNICFLRSTVTSGLTVKQLLLHYKDAVTALCRHQSYGYEQLLQQLGISNDRAAEGFFQFGLADLSIQQLNSAIQRCDLLLIFSTVEGTGRLTFSFNEKYPRDLMQQFARHYASVLEMMLQGLDTPLKDIELLGAGERAQLLSGCNATRRNIIFSTLPELFRETASAIPRSPAVVFRDQQLSYSALDRESDRFAAYLHRELKVNKGDIVALDIASSFGLIVSIIGILKAGAVVLPLAPEGPEERKAYIISDSRARVVITARDLERIAAAPDAYTGGPGPVAVSGHDDAYIIYTSGSTGKPKGVRLSHDNIVNMLSWFRDYFAFTSSEVLPQKTTVNFVDSVVELLLPVTLGRACIYLRPYDDINKDPEALLEWLKACRASILQFVPSVFDNLAAVADISSLGSLKQLILSGEEVKKQYAYNFNIYNLYGCSEGTASSTIYKFNADDDACAVIGKPIYNTYIYILDKDLELLPYGATGDIYIGGRGLAGGYLHNEELTREKFIPNPYRQNELLYRTGDRGCWNGTHDLVYLGRADNQVKIRGIRIEPGEIEHLLAGYPGVNMAFVQPYEADGEVMLAAYVVHDDSVQPEQLKAFLRQQLPSYMVPACLASLKEIPFTASGKVNRRMLPNPLQLKTTAAHTFVAPRNETEGALVRIWQEVLGCEEPVGIQHDFIELGGHSLKGVKVISRIEKELHVKISLRDIFLHTTIERLALLVQASSKVDYGEILPVPGQPDYELSHAQKRLWILDQLEPGQCTYNMSHAYLLKGALSIDAMEQALSLLIRRHESLRTIFTTVAGAPRQQILDDLSLFRMELTDLRNNPGAKETVYELVSEEVKRPFDLSKGPLIRTHLFRYEEGAYAFSCTLHHIVTDGWSMRVLMNELLVLYDACCAGRPSPLEALSIQYKDYCAWHNRLLAADGVNSARSYWAAKLEGELPVLHLPISKPRTANRTYAGAMTRFSFGSDLSDRLAKYNSANNVTLFVSLVAFVKVLLHIYSGQEDIIVGSPVAGRNRQELENQIGFYLNNLVLRSGIRGGDNFSQVLQEVRQTVLAAFDHQHYPYDKIIEDLHPAITPGRNPLYDVMIVMAIAEENAAGTPGLPGSVNVEGLKVEHTISKLDLSFFFFVEEHITVGIEYRTDLFDEPVIARMAADLQHLISVVLEGPDMTVHAIRKAVTGPEVYGDQAHFERSMTGVMDEEF